MPNETLTQSVNLNYNLFTPIVQFTDTEVTGEYWPGHPYQLFRDPGQSQVTISFMVPPAVRNYPAGSMYLRLNHCRTTANGIVDMFLNGAGYRLNYTDTPIYGFGVQVFEIPYSQLNMTEPNSFVIRLNPSSPGVYWLADIAFSFENSSQCLVYAGTDHVDRNFTGSIYTGITVTDQYRYGNPYLLFHQPSSTCTITFFTPEHFYSIADGTLTIALNHCSTSANGAVNMYLNGNVYLSRYAGAPTGNFGVQNFTIPFSSLNLDGSANTFEIQLYTGGGSYGFYWLSDVTLQFSAPLPAVTYPNFETYVKNWILMQRANIQELSPIPRDDLSAWQFIQNAPSWFYLPFLPISPTELKVLISQFPTSFLSVGWGVKALNDQARNFHAELLTTDLPRKNALRHAYWMALITRSYGAEFADALGNAHEYAHVDLTIEGPFDHVTDKINNAVGIELARNNPTADLATLVDNAWANQQLAWARDFQNEPSGQTATVSWQTPLDKLAQTYGVIPDFTSTEVATLSRMGVRVPNKPPIHDEL